MEGEVETVEFCFTVTELNDPHILRYFRIESLPRSARGEYRKCLSVHKSVVIYIALYFTFAEVLDYLFYNETLIFNGSYSFGDSECMTVRVFGPEDNLVEGREVFYAIVFPGASSLTFVSIFIIDNDCELVLFLMCSSAINLQCV